MAITYYPELIQGSEEWFAQRCGLITAGSMNLILTPTLKMASNEKERTHLYELVAQRATRYVEPTFVGDDMLRGLEDEVYAKALYAEKYAPITDYGMISNDALGFDMSFSPDGLVGDDGMIECKSRRQKWHVQTIIEGELPVDYRLQIQTGMMIAERKWCDFISYCAGLPMFVLRVYPDPAVQAIVREAATNFEARVRAGLRMYEQKIVGLYPTERRVEQEIMV